MKALRKACATTAVARPRPLPLPQGCGMDFSWTSDDGATSSDIALRLCFHWAGGGGTGWSCLRHAGFTALILQARLAHLQFNAARLHPPTMRLWTGAPSTRLFNRCNALLQPRI